MEYESRNFAPSKSAQNPRGASMLAERSLDIRSSLQSSLENGGADDSLKDADNLAWLAPFDSVVVSDWLTVLEWVRVADRLIERDRYSEQRFPSGASFADFRRDWQSLRKGTLPSRSPFLDLFGRLQTFWTSAELGQNESNVWEEYLDALDRYTTPALQIESLDDYASMLYGLSGTFFQALPYAPKHLAPRIGQLGMLDQFFNNLRDLGEDLRRGSVNFPAPLLDRFKLSRAALLATTSKPDPRLAQLVDYLLCEFASPLKEAVVPMVADPHLHPSWRACLQHTLRRYARIENVLRECACCPDWFSATYWPLVVLDQRVNLV